MLDTPLVHEEWRHIVVAVSGVREHDARIAAAIKVHLVTTLLTYNTRDFVRYPWFEAVHPHSVVQ